jgi:hypothetical protein
LNVYSSSHTGATFDGEGEVEIRKREDLTLCQQHENQSYTNTIQERVDSSSVVPAASAASKGIQNPDPVPGDKTEWFTRKKWRKQSLKIKKHLWKEAHCPKTAGTTTTSIFSYFLWNFCKQTTIYLSLNVPLSYTIKQYEVFIKKTSQMQHT